jgi:hypothetical protein
MTDIETQSKQNDKHTERQRNIITDIKTDRRNQIRMTDEQKYRQTQSMERGIICRLTNIKSKLEKNKRMIDK